MLELLHANHDKVSEMERTMKNMNENHWGQDSLQGIVESLCDSYEAGAPARRDGMPQREIVIDLLGKILEVMFPGYAGNYVYRGAGLKFTIGEILNEVYLGLQNQIQRALSYRCRKDGCEQSCETECCQRAEQTACALLHKIPELRSLLMLDVQAALDGDPATKSSDEIILAYPGFRAICVHRIAHELYAVGIPLIPRIMSEYAHSLTGIDINPGAQIGRSFFIDHGTGVVVGETAVIGDNVKLYQGVTLGALSFPKDEGGHLLKGHKRHPNIEDNVTIYAAATILGNVTIGHDSVIGGNVWLTEGVPPFSKVRCGELPIEKKTRC